MPAWDKPLPPVKPVSSHDAHLMAVVCLRNYHAASRIFPKFDPDSLRLSYPALRVTLGAAKALLAQRAANIGFGVIQAKAHAHVDDFRQEYLDPNAMKQEITSFLRFAFDDQRWPGVQADPSLVEIAIDVAKRLAAQGVHQGLQEKLLQNPGDQLPAILQQASADFQASQTIGSSGSKLLFSPGWMERPSVQPEPTQIAWLDKLLDGGIVPYEAVGVMAPINSYKTLLSTQLSVQSCRTCAGLSTDELLVSLVVCYEAGADEMRMRLISNCAHIDYRDLRAAMSGNGRLSTARDLSTMKPYERWLYEQDLKFSRRPMLELERLQQAEALLNRHLILLDFTGRDPELRGAGSGLAPEILAHAASRVQEHSRMNGGRRVRVRQVLLDYVVLMCRRHAQAKNLDRGNIRHLVNELPMAIKATLGNEWGCSSVLLQQLSTQANKLGPMADIDGTESMEGRAFKENVDYALVGNKPTKEEPRLARIKTDKQRRSAPIEPVITHLQGPFQQLIDVSDVWCVHGGKFVRRESLKQAGLSTGDPDSSELYGSLSN